MNKGNVKSVYWTVFCITYGLLFLVCLSEGVLTNYAGLMGLPLMFLSAIVAAVICRRLGLSKASRTIEILNRGSVAPIDAPVQYVIRYSRAIWRNLTIITAIFTLVLAYILVFLPNKPGTEKVGCWTVGFFCAIAVGCWAAYRFNWTFMGEANERGVRGYHRGSLKPRFVAWENIQGCEVFKVRDVTGSLSYPLFLFKDEDGRVLLSMTTLGSTAGQGALFKDVVQSYLAKVKQLDRNRTASPLPYEAEAFCPTNQRSITRTT